MNMQRFLNSSKRRSFVSLLATAITFLLAFGQTIALARKVSIKGTIRDAIRYDKQPEAAGLPGVTINALMNNDPVGTTVSQDKGLYQLEIDVPDPDKVTLTYSLQMYDDDPTPKRFAPNPIDVLLYPHPDNTVRARDTGESIGRSINRLANQAQSDQVKRIYADQWEWTRMAGLRIESKFWVAKTLWQLGGADVRDLPACRQYQTADVGRLINLESRFTEAITHGGDGVPTRALFTELKVPEELALDIASSSLRNPDVSPENRRTFIAQFAEKWPEAAREMEATSMRATLELNRR